MLLKLKLKPVKSSNSRLKRRITFRLEPNFEEYQTYLEQFQKTLQQEHETLQSQLEEILRQEEELLQPPEPEQNNDLIPGEPNYIKEQKRVLSQKEKPEYKEQIDYLTKLEQVLTKRLQTYKRLINLTLQTTTQLKITRSLYENNIYKTLKQSVKTLTKYLKQITDTIPDITSC